MCFVVCVSVVLVVPSDFFPVSHHSFRIQADVQSARGGLLAALAVTAAPIAKPADQLAVQLENAKQAVDRRAGLHRRCQQDREQHSRGEWPDVSVLVRTLW